MGVFDTELCDSHLQRRKAVRERLQQACLKYNDLISEYNGLIEKKSLDSGEKERMTNLRKGIDRLREEIEALEREEREANADLNRELLGLVGSGKATLWRGDGCNPDPGPVSVHELMTGSGFLSGLRGVADPARYTLEQVFKTGLLPARNAEVVEALITKSRGEAQRIASEWVQVAGSPKYFSAFVKLLGDPTKGHMLWDDQEREAFRRTREWQGRYKAMSTDPGVGGEMLPLVLDPAIMLASGGSNNPLRRISRQVVTSANAWQGITSDGVTAEWKAEGSEVSDATPTLTEAKIDVHFGSVFVPYSFEIGEDALSFGQELARLLFDAADQLQAEAFVNGTGSGEPKGLITALAGTESEVEPETPGTLAAEDVYALQSELPPRFQARAQWLAALPTINAIAQFETTNGSRLFPEVNEGRLLRRPLNECSNMPSVDDETPDYVLCYGDFQQFVIVDRVGSRLEIIPHLFGSHGRPTGQRGAFLWFRCGSDVTVTNAFRVLNLAASGS